MILRSRKSVPVSSRFNPQYGLWEIMRGPVLWGIASTAEEAELVAQEAREW